MRGFHSCNVKLFPLNPTSHLNWGGGGSGKPTVEAVLSQASVGHSGGLLSWFSDDYPMLADESGKFLLRRIIVITVGNIGSLTRILTRRPGGLCYSRICVIDFHDPPRADRLVRV